MPEDVDRIVEIKRAAEEEILRRPGVNGIDVGYKYVGGQRTDEIVIRVHVAEKGDVSAAERIPESIDGVPTDVLESHVRPLADTGSYNPLLGGISIGPERFVDGMWAGTLGAVVRDSTTGQRMILSNYHVMCVNEGWHQGIGSRGISHPATIDNPVTSRHIATIRRGLLDQDVDAAVASLDGVLSAAACEIQDLGPLAGTTPVAWVAVRKRGRTTGLTNGQVDSIDLKVTVDFGHGVGRVTLQHQISVKPTSPTTIFADQGDSGSVVVDGHGRVIGLLFAGDTRPSVGTGFVTPIEQVLKAMKVRLAVEGIGGYDLKSTEDVVVAYDFHGHGLRDHLVAFRPGRGAAYLVGQQGLDLDQNPSFVAMFRQPQGGTGIGGFDLSESADRLVSFAGMGSGPDLLLGYRPGTGIALALRPDGVDGSGQPIFTTVYEQGDDGGIGGFDLSKSYDRVIAYDYTGTGTLDHLVLYRPGKGAVFVVRCDGYGGSGKLAWTAIYRQPQGGSGIGGFDLSEWSDRIIALDLGDGPDHLVLYRPGTGIVFVVKPDGTDASGTARFAEVYRQGPDGGIGGFDLTSSDDRIIAFDYTGSGHRDHLVAYRPGKGIVFIMRGESSAGGALTFTPVVQCRGTGLGGFDLSDGVDRLLAFQPAKGRDQLIAYRPGAGMLWILTTNGSDPGDGSSFTPGYRAEG